MREKIWHYMFALKHEQIAIMRFGVVGVGEVIRQRDLKVIRRVAW